MIVDAHVVLGTSRFGTELTEHEALERWAREGIDLAIASPPHPVDHDFARANAELSEVVSRSGGRLVGLSRVDPWDGDAALELFEHSVRVLGHRGLFLHPAEERFRINDARLRAFASLAEELHVPVVIATGYPWASEPTQVAQFAQWSAGVPVVMTNGGQYNISGLSQTDAESALGLDNVHLHTSGVYREDFLQNVVRTYGADRVLFASSAPTFDVAFEAARVQLLHVTDEERQAVQSSNARRIFGLSDTGAQPQEAS